VLQHPNLDHPEVVGKKVILARRMLGDLFDLRLYPRSAIPFTAIECYKVALQIVEAIFHLHSQNVVHKDLKAENTLLDDHKNVMVTDFGFTFWPAPGKEPNYDNGTPVYLPPEILSRFVAKKSYSASELSAIDNPIDFFKQGEIWSLGLILYELFQGDPLLDALGVRALPDSFTHKIFQLHETFSSLDIQQSINTAIKGLISKISPGGEELSRLLQWMLRVAPGERPTIDQVRANLTRLTPTMDLENPAAAPATASVREVKQPELPSWMRSEKLSGDSPVYRALIHLYQALQYAQANPQISPRTHLEHINEALACLTQALAEEPSMNRLKKRVGKNARTLLAYMTDTVQEYRADLAAAVQAEAAAAGPAPL
jgi:serine/threonine protein kinase